MALVLGISSSHDAAACVYRNGRLIAAIAEERLTRVKCDGGRLPQRAIDAVLQAAQATRRDVDCIASIYGHFPEHYFRRETWAKELERRVSRVARAIRHDPRVTQFSTSNLLKHLRRKGRANLQAFERHFRRATFLACEGFRPDAEVRFYDHHLTHAASAAHGSGFGDCAVVTIDGEGDLDVHHTASLCSDGALDLLRVSDTPGNSPGFFYEEVTRHLGFTPLRHEGKVLGLAAFGDPARLLPAMQRALRASPNGTDFDSDFRGLDAAYDRRAEYLGSIISGAAREHVAAAAQQALESAVLTVVRSFLAKTGARRLAVNGGVFANVKLNQRLAELPEVDALFVFPAMSDAGNCIGAALLALRDLDPTGFVCSGEPLRDVYLGPAYSDDVVAAEIRKLGLRADRLDESALVERAARALHEGRVVGWFQGRMEFGPRALGNRSMLARATDASVNQALNRRLERTEFMPFAPSCLAEHGAALFPRIGKAPHAAEFMTVTFDIAPEWRDRVPAVVHVDGTARPQLVRRETNPLYWELIERYRQHSGIPLVLNTSFNVHEEPIVCAPAEALRAYSEGRIDCLGIGSYWLV